MNQRPELAIRDDGFKAMRVFQKQTQLNGDRGSPLGPERTTRDHAGQVFSIEILHRDVVAGFMIAMFIDSWYERTDLTQLLLKLGPPSLCGDYFEGIMICSVRDTLECDALIRSCVASQEYGTRHAMADLLDNLVRSKLLEYRL